MIRIWLLPFALLITATLIAIPLSRYLAWIMDGKYRPLAVFGWVEKHLDCGPQNWKQYAASLLIFNTGCSFLVFWSSRSSRTAAKSRRQDSVISDHYFP